MDQPTNCEPLRHVLSSPEDHRNEDVQTIFCNGISHQRPDAATSSNAILPLLLPPLWHETIKLPIELELLLDEILKDDSAALVCVVAPPGKKHALKQQALCGKKDSVDEPRKLSPSSLTEMLPQGFKPSPYSVLIGRGKRHGNVPGNKKLRDMATKILPEYANARSKSEKTKLVSMLINQVICKCPIGSFITSDAGRWWEVNDKLVREKVGYVLRDLLFDQYRSSSASKMAKRRKIEKAGESLKFVGICKHI
jgi:hypothetical protein